MPTDLSQNGPCEAGRTGVARAVPIWLTVGGVLLAWFLPPVFAVIITIRWRDISRRLRLTSLVFSLLVSAAVVWSALANGTGYELLSAFVSMWSQVMTFMLFSLCYMRRRGIRPSLCLKLAARFIYVLLIVGTIGAVIVSVVGCISLGRKSGFDALERVAPGMEKEQVLSVLSANATIMSTSEFTKDSDGTWRASPGSKYQSPSQCKALASVAGAESRTKKEVVRMIMVDRTWGWMGWDVFLLYFDRGNRLVAKDMIHLD